MALGLRTATGVFLDADELVFTTLAAGPVGPRVTRSERVSRAGQPLAALVEGLVEQKALPGQVVCGIHWARLFLLTLQLSPEEEQQSTQDLLAARVAHFKGNTVCNRAPVKLPSGTLSTILATPDEGAAELFAGLRRIKEKRLLLTGAPLALYRLSCRGRRPSRRRRCEVSVFVGASEALAVLAFDRTPLAVHHFEHAETPLAQGLELALLNLQARARDTLGLTDIQHVLLHGAGELDDVAEDCEDRTGIPTGVGQELPLDGETAAHALAFCGLYPDKRALNMFEPLFAPAGLAKNFPVRAAAVLLALLTGAHVLMAKEVSELLGESATLKKRALVDARAVGVALSDLEARHGLLSEQHRIAEYFVSGRAYLGEVLLALDDVVPATMAMLDVNAKDRLDFPRKKSKGAAGPAEAGRQISLSGTTVMREGDTSPPELGEFIAALHRSPVMREHFPRIVNSNVRLMPGVKETLARILITCSP